MITKECKLLTDEDPFREIYRLFSLTSYGKKLSREVRYSRYKPTGVSNALWVKLLGPDVDNMTHHLFTYEIAKKLINHCSRFRIISFSVGDVKKISIVAVIHDFAEAIVTDKMYDQKTTTEEQEELEKLRGLIESIFTTHNHGGITSSDIIQSVEEVVNNGNPFLWRVFNAIERVGYFLTGCRSWKMSKVVVDSDKELHEGLQWVTNNVWFNQIPALIDYSLEFPYVLSVLRKNRELIQEVFRHMPRGIFYKYRSDEIANNIKSFRRAKICWHEALKQGL